MIETRTIKQIQSELNRAKAQLDQMEKSHIYTDEDKNILRPKWEQTVNDLQNELDTSKARDIEVTGPVEGIAY